MAATNIARGRDMCMRMPYCIRKLGGMIPGFMPFIYAIYAIYLCYMGHIGVVNG